MARAIGVACGFMAAVYLFVVTIGEVNALGAMLAPATGGREGATYLVYLFLAPGGALTGGILFGRFVRGLVLRLSASAEVARRASLGLLSGLCVYVLALFASSSASENLDMFLNVQGSDWMVLLRHVVAPAMGIVTALTVERRFARKSVRSA